MVQATSEYNYQGVKKLFVLPYDDSYANSTVKVDSYQKIVFPIENIENCNIEIDDRSFYDQRINDPFKKQDEVRKTATGKGDDYTTSCFLDCSYFDTNYKTIFADVSKQNA